MVYARYSSSRTNMHYVAQGCIISHYMELNGTRADVRDGLCRLRPVD